MPMQPWRPPLNAPRKSHKRVLIDLGGNWCVDCVVLANFLKLPEMQRFIAAHYEMVPVDVGRFDRNLQIPARFGITGRLKGVPALLIATPDGKLVNGNDCIRHRRCQFHDAASAGRLCGEIRELISWMPLSRAGPPGSSKRSTT